MQIVQAVSGVFHHFELAHQLHRRNHLRKIYSTWPWARLKREGLPHSLVDTFPWIHTADYLLGRSRLYPRALSLRANQLNVLLAEKHISRTIPACDAFIAIAPLGLRTGVQVQQQGGIFLCDRGSTHHRFQAGLLREEHLRWKVPPLSNEDFVSRLEEKIYAAADGITVPSQVARRSYLQMGVPADKVHVIPYGVRLESFQRVEPPPSSSFEVLFAGHVSLRKGIPYLLEAFARLSHPRKRLTIVGAMSPEIRSLLPSLPTENVIFTGSQPQPQLAQLMGRSHVFVLPSVEEGLALVQAQAMACRCPVIATLATGAEDLFSDGVEGYIVPDRDIAALADRMQRIADDPILQQQLAEAAHLRVQSIGGWDDFGRQWDDLLHRLTGKAKDSNES